MSSFAVIENWLPTDLANDIAYRINNINDWSVRICDQYGGPRIVGPETLALAGLSAEEFAAGGTSSLNELARRGTMAYLFFVKSLIEFDVSLFARFEREMVSKANEVMGQNNNYLEEPQVTMYSRGCFLGQHSDGVGLRNTAFIANFTKNWQPDFGGCLTILDEGVWKVIPPTFNSLVLMNVRASSCHYVSQVSTWVENKRIAITGWVGNK